MCVCVCGLAAIHQNQFFGQLQMALIPTKTKKTNKLQTHMQNAPKTSLSLYATMDSVNRLDEWANYFYHTLHLETGWWREIAELKLFFNLFAFLFHGLAPYD